MSSPARSVVVAGVDGSTASRDAVRWAAEYGKLTGAELRAVSSWRWPNYITRIPPGVDLEADTRRTLAEVAAEIRADFPEVPVSEHVIEGPGGPALLSQAEDASLLVVGAHGSAAFPGMLLGSVAEYCVRNGHCPVVVVRTPAE
ncbi:MAG: universal stress protein [Actinomycetota bacterium]|nr:universal stress protein [Actinomycetota bacterium]